MLFRAAVLVAIALHLPGLMGFAVSSERFWRHKKVLITGASSGLGEALAYHLSESGASLVLGARRRDQLERVASRCKIAYPLELDMCSPPATIEAKAATAMELLDGRVDILICCAGVGQRTDVVDTSAEAHEMIMGANFGGSVALTRALLPSMLTRGDGSIAVVSSVQGFFGQPARASYAASKAAMINYYDALRAEVAAQGINVTVVAPGYIATEHSASAVGGDGSRDGNAAKGMDPAVLAVQIADAVAAGQPQLVASQLSGRVAMLLRTLWPEALFKYLQRKAVSTPTA
jgi:dehydrogenase/reductase SDR family protein 7B